MVKQTEVPAKGVYHDADPVGRLQQGHDRGYLVGKVVSGESVAVAH